MTKQEGERTERYNAARDASYNFARGVGDLSGLLSSLAELIRDDNSSELDSRVKDLDEVQREGFRLIEHIGRALLDLTPEGRQEKLVILRIRDEVLRERIGEGKKPERAERQLSPDEIRAGQY